jgi:hypothetical protein
LILPAAFLGGVNGGDGPNGVGGSVTGVAGHVWRGGGLAGGSGSGPGRTLDDRAGGGVSGHGGGACLPHSYLAARPRARGLDGFPRPIVTRVLPLEEREHPLGAVGGPKGQCSLV